MEGRGPARAPAFHHCSVCLSGDHWRKKQEEKRRPGVRDTERVCQTAGNVNIHTPDETEKLKVKERKKIFHAKESKG